MVEAHRSQQVIIKTIITTGDAADQIVQIAEAEKSDLIDIATHGRTGWRRFILGSVAERVVRNAGSPVFPVQAPRED